MPKFSSRNPSNRLLALEARDEFLPHEMKIQHREATFSGRELNEKVASPPVGQLRAQF